MKQSLFSFSIVALMVVVAVPGVQAQKSAAPVSAFRTLRSNAHDIVGNAGNYQWKRVTLEVERMLGAARRASAYLESEGKKEQAEMLRMEIKALRTARLNRDNGQAIEAAQKIQALCEDVLKP